MNTASAMTTDLEAIRERARAATPGPWAPDPGAPFGSSEFFIHARQDVDTLLAMVDHLRAKHAETHATSMRRGEEIARLRGELNAKR